MAVSEERLLEAIDVAGKKHAVIDLRLTTCEKLDFVYNVLMGIKKGSPWYWQIAIRGIHGLISNVRERLNCA